MATGVDERTDFPFGVARDQDRRAADERRDEIVRLRDLRFEAQKTPSALEDESLLECEQRRVGVHVAVHAKHALVDAIVHVEPQVFQIHLGWHVSIASRELSYRSH